MRDEQLSTRAVRASGAVLVGPLPHKAVDTVLTFDPGALCHPHLKRLIRKVMMD